MALAGSGDRLSAEAQEWKKPRGWRGPPGKGQINSRHFILQCPGERGSEPFCVVQMLQEI